MVAADIEFDAAVLGEAALGDVEIGHDLNTTGDGGGEVPWGGDEFVEDAIGLHADAVFLFEGLEMDV